MSRAVVVVLMCAASAIAQPKLSAPLVGVARDSGHHLRLVDGVSGNFVLRDTIGTGVTDWAFDGNSGLAKTDTEWLTLGGNGAIVRRLPAPGRDAVLGPQNAFLPETAELWQAGPQGDSKVAIEPGAIAGSVIALGPTKARGAQLAVCRANQLWLLSINTTTGAVTHEWAPGGAIGEQACLSAGGGSLVVMSDRLLLATAKAILIQTAAGVERRIPISASHAVRAGAQWVQVESARAPSHIIRIASDGETVYQLPAAKELP